MTNTLYVTTTIPYVNAPPHIGFALELVQADVIARYHRLLGSSVRFQTGTDENAFTNVLSAKARGVTVEALVDENSARFRVLRDSLGLSYDQFVRTTEPSHAKAVHAFLEAFRPGDIYQAPYRGLYCARCEDFYLERDLEGRSCPQHGTPVVEVEETNHFFRLSAYEDRLRELIRSRRLHIIPESREAEVLSFLDRGLFDISISRDRERSCGWGIPFPGDPEQVVYVWVDALVNYLSGLGYPGNDEDLRFWHPDATKLHVIGKNVWKFHAVYWPAFLLSAGIELPDQILVHGFLTNEGVKIAKSSGNAIDPEEYVRSFGTDAVRFFLLRHVRPFEDTDFNAARVEATYTSDLANNLGNLCSRLTTLCEVAELDGLGSTQHQTPPPSPDAYRDHLETFRFDLALATLWEEISDINRDLSNARPWDDLKAGRLELAQERLAGWVSRLDAVAYWLAPFLPATAETIRKTLAQPRLRKCEPLFPRTGQRNEGSDSARSYA